MWNVQLIVLCVVVNVLHTGLSANILCFFTLPFISHHRIFQPIIRGLAHNGHNLTVVTSNPMKDAALPNVHEIDITSSSYRVWDKYNMSTFGIRAEIGSTDLAPLVNAFLEIMDAMLSDEHVQSLIHQRELYKFDLLISEFPNVFVRLFQQIYNTSFIGISNMPIHFGSTRLIGNPEHSTLYPDLNLPYGNRLTFFQRVHSFLYSLVLSWMVDELIYQASLIYAKHFGSELVDQIEWLTITYDLVLVNYNPILFHPRTNVPSVIEFTGIHVQPPKELPEDFRGFLDSAIEGAIYISFGSNLQSCALPEAKREMILHAISGLPFKFLWKYEGALDNLPENLMITKWAPQQDVLRHPNVKLFITQGGLQSLDEAMYTKTPVLVIPFFGDQSGNAVKVEEAQVGKRLSFATLTANKLQAMILEIINDDGYKTRMEEVYNILIDQPVPALDKALWWIEYVLRHKGARHLRSSTDDTGILKVCISVGFSLVALFLVTKFVIKFARRPVDKKS